MKDVRVGDVEKTNVYETQEVFWEHFVREYLYTLEE